MSRLYFCPNCGASITYGCRFCTNCGIGIDRQMQQIMPNNSSCGCQYSNNQQGWNQQYAQGPLYNQASTGREQNPNRKHHANDNYNNATQQRNHKTGNATKLMRTEIMEIVNELLDRQIRYN